MDEAERRSLVKRLLGEARGIRLTLAGSAVGLILVARLLIAMRVPWLTALVGVVVAVFWVRLSRRLAAISATLRRGGLPEPPGPRSESGPFSPVRYTLMLLSVLVTVGACMLVFLWLTGKLGP